MRITLLEWVLAAFAVWRLTWLVVADEITRPIREWVTGRARDVNKGLAFAIQCPYCASVWIAPLVLAWAYMTDGALSYLVLGVPALSIIAATGCEWLDGPGSG